MLALFVGVVTLLRYDESAVKGLFEAIPMHEQTAVGAVRTGLSWLILIKERAPVYLLLATSFVL